MGSCMGVDRPKKQRQNVYRVRRIDKRALRPPTMGFIVKESRIKTEIALSLESHKLAIQDRKPTDRKFQELWEEIPRYFAVHKWKNLKALEYKDAFSVISDKYLEIFITGLQKNFQCLKYLDLKFFACDDVSIKGFKSFVTLIGRNFTNLRHLGLSFNSFPQGDDVALKAISSGICKRLPQLEELSLDFELSSLITDEGLDHLSFHIGKLLINLKSLSIILYKSKQLTNKGIESFAANICSGHLKLQQLKLNFGGCDQITDHCLDQLGLYIGSQLPTLQALALDVHGCDKITHHGLEMMGSQMGQRLTNLARLEIGFGRFHQPGEEGLDIRLTELVKDFTTLKELKLTFFSCAKKGNKEVFLGDNTLVKLNRLEINCDRCDITDQGFREIGDELASHFYGLRKIDLNFENCHDITNSGLEQFGLRAAICKDQWKELNFVFTACSRVNWKIYRKLKEILVSIPRLTVQIFEFNEFYYMK